MCGGKGLFQVEDLPVGPRWFCTEKHFAEYAGLPVKESGYYGFEAEGELERKYFARFGDQRGGKEWGEYTFTWFNDVGDWKPIDKDTTGWDEDDYEEFRENTEYDLVNQMLENPKSSLYGKIENNTTYAQEEEFDTTYKVLNEDGEVEWLNLLISWEEPANVEQRIKYYDREPLYRLEFLGESFEAECVGCNVSSDLDNCTTCHAPVCFGCTSSHTNGKEFLCPNCVKGKTQKVIGGLKYHKAESYSAESKTKDDMLKIIQKRLSDAGYDGFPLGPLYVAGYGGYFDIDTSEERDVNGNFIYRLKLYFSRDEYENIEKEKGFEMKVQDALMKTGILKGKEVGENGFHKSLSSLHKFHHKYNISHNVWINGFYKDTVKGKVPNNMTETKSCSHDNLGIKTMEQLNGELLLTLVCDACGKRTSTSAPIESGAWDAESFEAKETIEQQVMRWSNQPYYSTAHTQAPTVIMHPKKCNHFKTLMPTKARKWQDWGTPIWDNLHFYETIEEMFIDQFNYLADSQWEGMHEEGQEETLAQYNSIKTIGDARKFLRNYGFKLDFAPCFRKERDYDSKALNALPINIHKDYNYYKDNVLFHAETKKLPPVEKAIDTGIASGATMEGLETLLAAEGSLSKCHICYVGDDDVEIDECRVCKNGFCRRCRGCPSCEFICEDCEGKCPYHKSPQEIAEYDLQNEYISKPHSYTHNVDKFGIPKKCEYYWKQGEICYGCQAQYPNHLLSTDQSLKERYEMYVVWKNANRNREQFIGRAETLLAAEDDGIGSDIRIKFLNEYFAKLKAKDEELAKQIEYRIKNEMMNESKPSIEPKIIEAGFDPEIITEWIEWYAVGLPEYQIFEMCRSCEGDGEVMIEGSYWGGDRYDPPEADFKTCDDCLGSGLIDPSDYMYGGDDEIEYMAEDENGMRILDIEDFNKIADAIQATGQPVTVLLDPNGGRRNTIDIIVGMDAPQSIRNAIRGVMEDLGYRGYSIVGNTSILERREYSEIRRVNGGHKHYRAETLLAAEWADEHPCEHCGSTDIDYGNNWKCHDCGRYAAESFNATSKGFDGGFRCGDCDKTYLYHNDAKHGGCEKARRWYDEDVGESCDCMEDAEQSAEICCMEAESYSAESDELEESKKRTKMSMIRTGLAITTFGIVIWNLWTNKKQEKDISDIMDLI